MISTLTRAANPAIVGALFQSLIGILVDFDAILINWYSTVVMFQSLIGILVDFDFAATQAASYAAVSIPDRDFS